MKRSTVFNCLILTCCAALMVLCSSDAVDAAALTQSVPFAGRHAADPSPACTNGSQYYNTVSNLQRCCASATWHDCGGASLGLSGAVSQSNAGTQLDPMFPLPLFATTTSITASSHWFLNAPSDVEQSIIGMAVTTGNPAPTNLEVSLMQGYTLNTSGEGGGTGRYSYMAYHHPNNNDATADVWEFRGNSATGGTILISAPAPHGGDSSRYGHISFETCPGGCGISSFTRALDNGADRSFLIMDDGVGGSTIAANAFNSQTCVFDGDGTNPSCIVNVTVHAQKCTCTVRGATSLATIENCGLGNIVLGAPSTIRVFSGAPGSVRTVVVNCF